MANICVQSENIFHRVAFLKHKKEEEIPIIISKELGKSMYILAGVSLSPFFFKSTRPSCGSVTFVSLMLPFPPTRIEKGLPHFL